MSKSASFLVAFTYEDVNYQMQLCSKHTRMFDRDMNVWVQIADECGIGGRPKIPVRVTIGGVETDLLPGPIRGEISAEAMSYTFTEHAVQRMAKRKITRQEVLDVISAPGRTTMPGDNSRWPDAQVWLYGDIKIVVNPKRRRVISVMWRSEDTSPTTPERRQANG